MTPKDHLAAGTTWKCWSLKALSNKPYPSPVNLLITSIESQKCLKIKNCQPHEISPKACSIEFENFRIRNHWKKWKFTLIHVSANSIHFNEAKINTYICPRCNFFVPKKWPYIYLLCVTYLSLWDQNFFFIETSFQNIYIFCI